jgi:hypothetical protein
MPRRPHSARDDAPPISSSATSARHRASASVTKHGTDAPASSVDKPPAVPRPPRSRFSALRARTFALAQKEDPPQPGVPDTSNANSIKSRKAGAACGNAPVRPLAAEQELTSAEPLVSQHAGAMFRRPSGFGWRAARGAGHATKHDEEKTRVRGADKTKGRKSRKEIGPALAPEITFDELGTSAHPGSSVSSASATLKKAASSSYASSSMASSYLSLKSPSGSPFQCDCVVGDSRSTRSTLSARVPRSTRETRVKSARSFWSSGSDEEDGSCCDEFHALEGHKHW